MPGVFLLARQVTGRTVDICIHRPEFGTTRILITYATGNLDVGADTPLVEPYPSDRSTASFLAAASEAEVLCLKTLPRDFGMRGDFRSILSHPFWAEFLAELAAHQVLSM